MINDDLNSQILEPLRQLQVNTLSKMKSSKSTFEVFCQTETIQEFSARQALELEIAIADSNKYRKESEINDNKYKNSLNTSLFHHTEKKKIEQRLKHLNQDYNILLSSNITQKKELSTITSKHKELKRLFRVEYKQRKNAEKQGIRFHQINQS